MRIQITCSPRPQNVLDVAEYLVNRGFIEPDLARRFRASLSLDSQRGHQDIGDGLCGRRGRRLARSLDEVLCQECLALLDQQSDRSGVIG